MYCWRKINFQWFGRKFGVVSLLAMLCCVAETTQVRVYSHSSSVIQTIIDPRSSHGRCTSMLCSNIHRDACQIQASSVLSQLSQSSTPIPLHSIHQHANRLSHTTPPRTLLLHIQQRLAVSPPPPPHRAYRMLVGILSQGVRYAFLERHSRGGRRRELGDGMQCGIEGLWEEANWRCWRTRN